MALAKAIKFNYMIIILAITNTRSTRNTRGTKTKCKSFGSSKKLEIRKTNSFGKDDSLGEPEDLTAGLSCISSIIINSTSYQMGIFPGIKTVRQKINDDVILMGVVLFDALSLLLGQVIIISCGFHLKV